MDKLKKKRELKCSNGNALKMDNRFEYQKNKNLF